MLKPTGFAVSLLVLALSACNSDGIEIKVTSSTEEAGSNTSTENTDQGDATNNGQTDSSTDTQDSSSDDQDQNNGTSGDSSDSQDQTDDSTDDNSDNSSDTGNDDHSDQPSNASQVIQENTDGFCGVDGELETKNAGFTGEGYVNTDNANGAEVRWAITAEVAGNYTIKVRYADGGTEARPGHFVINGNTSSLFDATTTGDWTTYATSSDVSVYLNKGVNKIVLKATTGNGLPNIDLLQLASPALSPAECATVYTDDTDPVDTNVPTDVNNTSSSAEAPTAAAAKLAGANSEPLTNGFPSFIKTTVADATVVSSIEEFTAAVSSATAGDVIYLRAGTYPGTETIKLTASGTASNAIVISAYPGDERPVFDFSAMSESGSNRGFDLQGNYWHIYGFDIKEAGDNGMYVRGSHNTIEFLKFHDNHDTGLQLDKGAAFNFVKNSDSYYNADSSLENADGFAAKLEVGTGNYFYGCRAWQNLDDGFDGYLRNNDQNITTTWEYSWMIRNGYQKNGAVGAGDGNGFKTGGSDGKDLAHNGVYINTISAENTHDGYDQNSNRGELTFYHAVAFKNNRNFGLNDGESRILKSLTLKNSISLDSNSSDKFGATSEDVSNNSWQLSDKTSYSDFKSIDINELLAERQADGSLPVVSFFQLEEGSHLIDAGTDVGLKYNGSAPDLGTFESE